MNMHLLPALLRAVPFVCAAMVVACSSTGSSARDSDAEESDDAPRKQKRRTSTKPGERSARPAASARASASVAAPTAAPPAPPSASALALPPGRSPLPGAAEWDSVREVTVKGSTALGCETKMVREWLRVTCRGKNDTGGTPTTVQRLRGSAGEVFTASFGNVTSLVAPVVEGAEIDALFSWSDKAHKLVVRWPRGTPKPVIVGVFEGASSPLDRGADAALIARFHQRTCECDKQLFQRNDCAVWLENLDCLRTYESDCEGLLGCASGHPAAPPKCPPGTSNNGYHRCVAPGAE